ncbi:MAG: hypothetical protein RIQ88_194 [Actinomycetota bacterium]
MLEDTQFSSETPKYSLRSVDTLEEEIRSDLLKLLERGGKSSGALRELLIEKEHQPELVDQLIARFIEVGLIDDFGLAKDLAENLANRKSKARGLIARDLREKGFSSEVIEHALAQLDQDAELETAKDLAVNKMSRLSSLEPQVRARRVAGFLGRKGYSASVVWTAVKFAEESLSN